MLAPRSRPPLKRPRPRSWGRLIARVFLAVALVVAVVALVARFTRLDESLAAGVVGDRLGVAVDVGRLDWRLDGVTARDVRARFAEGPGEFFGVESVDVDLGLLPPRVKGVVLAKPRLVATERPDGSIDLEALARGARRGGGRPPPLELRDGTLEFRGAGPLHEKLAKLLAAPPSNDVTAPGASAGAVHVEWLRLNPVAGQSSRLIELDGVFVPFGIGRVHLQGSMDDDRLERLVVWIDPNEALDLGELRRALAPAVVAPLDRNALAGRVAFAVTLTWGAEAGARDGPKIAADLDLLGVTARPEHFPCTVSDLRGAIRWRDGELQLDALRGRHDRAPVTISGTIRGIPDEFALSVAVRVDSAVVDEELRAAFRLHHITAEILAALEPEGRYSVSAQVDLAAGETTPHVTIDLDLEECAGVFHGFADEAGVRHGLPMRVERIRGRVHVDRDGFSFEHAVGFTRGGARVEGSARMHGDELSGEIRAFDAPIDEELLAATEPELGSAVRDLVGLLGMRGRLDAAAHFAWHLHGPFALTIELEPRKVDLEPPAFPLPIRLEGGRVVVDDHDSRIEALRGDANGGAVAIRGSVTLAPDSAGEPPMDVTVSARDLALAGPFLAACRAIGEEKVGALLDATNPEGEIDLDVRWTRAEPSGPVDRVLRIAPQDVKVSFGGGAAVARHVRGAFSVTQRTTDDVAEPWRIDAESEGGLAGEFLGGALELRGRCDAEQRGDLRLTGGRLAIGQEMVAALAPFAPTLAELLEKNRWRGQVRATCTISQQEGKLAPTRIDVEPDAGEAIGDDEGGGVLIAPTWLPLPLRWLGGTMHADLAARRVRFDRLFGRIGDAHLALDDGTIEIDESGVTTHVSGAIDSLSFGEWIELVFGAERRKAMLPYGPLGRTHLAVRDLTFHVPEGSELIDRIAGEGQIEFDGWTFYTGGGLEELTGNLEVSRFSFERRDGGITDVLAEGRVSNLTLDLGAARFSNLEADLTLTEGRLSLPWLSADFAGGRLPRERNHLGVTLTGEMPFDGRLEVEAADVSRLLGDDAPRMRGLVGRVDGEVGLRGLARAIFRGEGVRDLEAAGTVSIRDAKLWSIPLFDKLYTNAIVPLVGSTEDSEGRPEAPRWTRGEFEFALQGTYLLLSRIELEGEPLVLYGQGTLGPDRLALRFHPDVKTGLGFVRQIPVLGWLVGLFFSAIERQVGAFRFQGPYGNPQVQWDPVSLMPRPDLAIRLERARGTTPRDLAMERF